MKDLLILKNITREKPGLLEELLAEHVLSYDVVDLDRSETLPPFDYRALVVLGGPDSANDATTKMAQELAYVRAILDRGVPYLGICLGLQVGVKALGGRVVKAPMKEVGLVDPDGEDFMVELTGAGRQDPLFAGLGETLKVFHLHGETVEPIAKMTVLAEGKFCPVQVVRLGERAYGIQSHFELTREMLGVWAAEDPDLVPLGAENVLAAFDRIAKGYTQTGRTIFTNFLRIAGLI